MTGIMLPAVGRRCMGLSRLLGLLGALGFGFLAIGPGPLEAATPPVLAPGQSATLLPDGRWLLIGGEGAQGPVDTMTTWTPSTGAMVAVTRGLAHARAWHTATVLPDGTVLIVGGWGAGGAVVDAVERFDPAWSSLRSESIRDPRARAAHTATLLTEGRVLFVGGVGADGALLADAELWEPGRSRAETLAAGLTTARAGHTARLLADGTVWI